MTGARDSLFGVYIFETGQRLRYSTPEEIGRWRLAVSIDGRGAVLLDDQNRTVFLHEELGHVAGAARGPGHHESWPVIDPRTLPGRWFVREAETSGHVLWVAHRWDDRPLGVPARFATEVGGRQAS
jgi:hypothetical protein